MGYSYRKFGQKKIKTNPSVSPFRKWRNKKNEKN
jgi:hypothetical protein